MVDDQVEGEHKIEYFAHNFSGKLAALFNSPLSESFAWTTPLFNGLNVGLNLICQKVLRLVTFANARMLR
ncbi:MAG: hypothetical protein DHS20C18_45910 [Saprospiraceae bacterium]|nr:MAG: hypothetical protein DHS20C18_45910 [Saprospiraceae bacterium]